MLRLFPFIFVLWVPPASAEEIRNGGEFSEAGKIQFELPPGFYFNEEAPNQLQREGARGAEMNPTTPVLLPAAGHYRANIYYCEESSRLCFFERIEFAVKSLRSETSIRIPVGVKK